MVAPTNKNPWARWLVEKRKARFPSQVAALAAIRQLTGVAIHPSEYGQWEGGSRVPRDENPKVQALYAVFGKPPAPDANAHADAVAAAIDRQTDVLAELVAELRAIRDAQLGSTDALSQVLGALLPGDAVSRLLSADRNGTAPLPRGERVPRRGMDDSPGDAGRSRANDVPPRS